MKTNTDNSALLSNSHSVAVAELMDPDTQRLIPTHDLSRCLHRTPTGRQCHFSVAEKSASFCSRHTSFHLDNSDSLDLVPVLLGKQRKLNAATDIQRVLGRLFILLAAGRITAKRASTLTYIIQQLLRTLPAVERENNLQSDDEPQQIIFDLPRPKRD